MIHRGLEALHDTQGFTGPELNTALYRMCPIRKTAQTKHYTQG